MTLNEMVKNFEINCKKVERIVANEKFEVKYIMKGEKEKLNKMRVKEKM